MALIELKPKQRTIDGNPRQQIRVSFLRKISKKDPNINKKQVLIYVGSDIAQAFNVTIGDKLAFFYDSENPFIWTLKKADHVGYSLQKPRQGDASVYLQIIWNVADISDKDLGIKIVRHEVTSEGIVIYFNEVMMKEGE